jgi:hypothetical protein
MQVTVKFTWLRRGVMLGALGFALGVLAWSLIRSRHAVPPSLAGELYKVDVFDETPGEVLLLIQPVGEGAAAWEPYKAASDARIDAWVADPASAPTIIGRPMTLTFTHPLTQAELLPILQAGNFEVDYHMLIGTDSRGEQTSSYGSGPVDYSNIGAPYRDPGCDSADPDIPALR